MASLHYLTVQDMLWINLQVEGKVNRYDYAKLEEATFYQYAYGQSTNLLLQAARFVSGFVKKAPFESGNEATAFVGVLGFLEVNGLKPNLTDSDALVWFREALQNPESAIKGLSFEEVDHHALAPDLKAILTGIIARYPKTLAALSPVAA
jgi:prophage maintenance system killer protein